MSRGPQTFRQRDLTKAIRAVVAAGMPVVSVEVDKGGKIVVTVADRGKISHGCAERANEWDSIS